MSIAPQRGIGDVARCAFVFQTRWVAAQRGGILLFILRILAIPLQTKKRAADKPPCDRQMHRGKAPRSFMSIEPLPRAPGTD